MTQKYLLIIGILITMGIFFTGLVIYAQEPQLIEEDPFLPPQEEQECEPVKPDELEGISGNELVRRWLNFGECRGIDINQIPESKYTVDYTIWFMSSHEIVLSEGLDPKLKEHMKKVPQDHLSPVIIQPKRAISIAEMIELINLGLRYYRGSALTNGAYLSFIPANSINEIVSKSYITGVTLFKPSFKYTKIPATEDKIETHVNTIEEPKSYHESDLKRIGVSMIYYDSTLKLYVVKMSSS